MTLKEHLNMICRAVKLLYSLSRRYLISLTAGSIVSAVLPYVPIYFSARLIDALTAGAGFRTLAYYAVLTVSLAAVLRLIEAWLNAQKEIGEKEFACGREWLPAQLSLIHI